MQNYGWVVGDVFTRLVLSLLDTTADFRRCAEDNGNLYLSVVTVGELQRGVDLIRHRGGVEQARLLAAWLARVIAHYRESILPFDLDIAQAWGRLRVAQPENSLEKQIAATALVHDLVVVTRNSRDFARTGVRLLAPFTVVE